MAIRITRIEDTASAFKVEYMDEGKCVYQESFAPRPPAINPMQYANDQIRALPQATLMPPPAIAVEAEPEPAPIVEHEPIAIGEAPAPDDPNQPQPPSEETSTEVVNEEGEP